MDTFESGSGSRVDTYARGCRQVLRLQCCNVPTSLMLLELSGIHHWPQYFFRQNDRHHFVELGIRHGAQQITISESTQAPLMRAFQRLEST